MDNSKEIYIDTDVMRNVKTQMLDVINELKANVSKSLVTIEDTKQVYNTKSSKSFRNHADDFLNERLNYIINSLIPFIESLEDIAKNYDELHKEDTIGVTGV